MMALYEVKRVKPDNLDFRKMRILGPVEDEYQFGGRELEFELREIQEVDSHGNINEVDADIDRIEMDANLTYMLSLQFIGEKDAATSFFYRKVQTPILPFEPIIKDRKLGAHSADRETAIGWAGVSYKLVYPK